MLNNRNKIESKKSSETKKRPPVNIDMDFTTMDHRLRKRSIFTMNRVV